MEDINLVIAGAAGEGVQTIGDILVKAVASYGYAVFSWTEFESRIKGGNNSYSIRIGNEPFNAPLIEADILLALNSNAAEKYRGIVKKKGIIISPQKEGARSVDIPFAKLAREMFGRDLYANMIAIGSLTASLGMEIEPVMQIIAGTFLNKGEEVLSANRQALEKGYSVAEKQCYDMCPWKLLPGGDLYYVIPGNESIALGAALGGCRFMSAYPMSPSTGIITYLSSVQDRMGVFIEQAEDEISAINMAIGASFAGARAMTATSGGGFALMVEGLSLAGMTETPLVVVLAQRPGPATGLPTRTAQGDLLFAVNAGHGEFPKLILAPSDAKDAFHKMVRAFNLADEFQTVAIVMSDQFLADSHFSVKDFELEESAPEIRMPETDHISDYRRYRLTDSGISPRLFPGMSGQLVCADSDEHDEYGHITENLAGIAHAMANKRIAKLDVLKKRMLPPEEFALDDAEIVFIGWGTTRGAIMEAVTHLKSGGIKAGLIHFTELWPLPEYTFPSRKAYWSIEGNALGQFSRLLKSEYEIRFSGHISRYDGLPITAAYIAKEFHEKFRPI